MLLRHAFTLLIGKALLPLPFDAYGFDIYFRVATLLSCF